MEFKSKQEIHSCLMYILYTWHDNIIIMYNTFKHFAFSAFDIMLVLKEVLDLGAFGVLDFLIRDAQPAKENYSKHWMHSLKKVVSKCYLIFLNWEIASSLTIQIFHLGC